MDAIIRLKGIVAVSVALALAGGPVFASDSMRATSAVRVLSGGVGENARQAMRQKADGYELKLVFASTPSGSYLAGVPVTIRNQVGTTVVDEVSQGPWMFVDLPSGSYTVKATEGNSVQTKNVVVRQGSNRTIHFRWPEKLDAVTVHTAGS
jgi:hypothetical protein